MGNMTALSNANSAGHISGSDLLIRHGEVLLFALSLLKLIHLSTSSRRTDFKHNLTGLTVAFLSSVYGGKFRLRIFN
jgi:hypothetical protein